MSAHIQDATYVDDRALIVKSRCEVQHMVKILDMACERWWGMHISVKKILAVGEQHDLEHLPITLEAKLSLHILAAR